MFTTRSLYQLLRNNKDKFRWYVRRADGAIRARKGNQWFCPITAAHYIKTRKREGLAEVGTLCEKGWQVAFAADNVSFCDKKIRRNLLRAIGLSPEAQP